MYASETLTYIDDDLIIVRTLCMRQKHLHI